MMIFSELDKEKIDYYLITMPIVKYSKIRRIVQTRIVNFNCSKHCNS